jgi:hypothetical protein
MKADPAEIPPARSGFTERRRGERRSPWPTAIFQKSERRNQAKNRRVRGQH